MRWRTWWHRASVAGVVAVAVVVALGVSAGAGDTPVTVVGVQPETPDVSGTRMVWADKDGASYDVFLYDSSTGESLRVASTSDDEVEPSISGNTVVYTRRTAAGADIYAYDITSRQTVVVTNASGDQIAPSIAGTYVAWEDHANGYHGEIWGRNLASGTPFKIDSGYNAELTRPKVGGSVVVYQIRPGGVADDADVKSYDFASAAFTNVAATDAEEALPATDGRYVAWADGTAGDMDIKAYDLESGTPIDVRTQIGEQTLPCVADGKVYWIDSSVGKRLHVDTFDLDSATFSAFDNRSASDMVAVNAEGTSIAWLETKGASLWQVKAYLNAAPAVASAGGVLPVAGIGSPFRLAQISTGGDATPPTVVDVSVAPGATKVDASGDLAVYFSEPLDPKSVTGTIVTLRNEATGEQLDASVSYSAVAGAVIVDPVASLAEGTYTLSIGVTVTDLAGNSLVEPLDLTFATGGEITADTTKPTKPGGPWARPDGTANVEVSWITSADNVGIAYYRVYRYTVPGGTLLGSWDTADGSATSLVVPKQADETVPKKYTYYYAVRAYDTATPANFSSLSSYVAADPHGTYIFGQQINNCANCHSVHGGVKPATWWSLGAQSAEACYQCHGSTDAATSYGYGSTKNAQAKFWDYSATPLPDAGTQHRNDFMVSQRAECDVCHTPHKKPYNEAAGVKDPATSYSKLLKGPSDPGDASSALVYSTDQTPFGKAFCFACHGSASGGALTFMTAKGGASAYSNTSGDHNQAQYDAAGNPSNVAHDDEVVQYTLRDGVTDPGPLNNCAACHNEHAAATGSLADYRRSGTTAATYNQAGLCFACHSSASTETRSVGSVPFAWNSRDVKAQFTKASKHPYTASIGAPVPEGATWLQTAEADFSTDTHTRTSVVAGGSGVSGAVQLAPFGGAGATLFDDDFESGGFGNWNSSNWGTDNNSGNAHGGTYSAVMNTVGADELMVKTVDTAGRTNVQISFWLMGTNTTENTDYVQLQVYNTGTTSWDTVRDIPLDDRVTTYRQFTDSIPASYYSATMQFRILGRCNMADEYQHVDDVAVTADPVAGSYQPSGNVVSTPVLASGGTVNSWNSLRYTGNQPAGSTFRLDVLDGADSSVLVSGLTLADTPYSLIGIDKVAHPSLKLRARFTGDAPAPPSISDNFDDNSFDTAKWTDYFISSDDPDSLGPQIVLYESFEDDPGWQTNFPTQTGDWARSTAWDPVGTYDIRGGNAGTNPDLLDSRAMGLNGWSNVNVSFQWQRAGLDAGEYMRVQYSTNGSTWNDLWSIQGNGGTSGGTQSNLAIPSPTATTYIRLRVEGADGTEYGYWDDITVSGTPPATSNWPQESGGQLTIRAEGSDFGGTGDQGEFTYIQPAAASWIAGNDFEAVVRVPSYNNLGSNGWMKAGLMLRTGTTEANAQASGSKMAGVYVTDTNGIDFEYRTAVNGAAASGGNQAGDVPVWLKLARVGNVITSYMSSDGSSWTTVGSQTVSMDTYVLVGVCLTSHVDGTFSESTFDDFSVTQIGGTGSTVTPRLDDWSIDYVWTPAPSGRSMTCYNCHNTHYVQKGTAGSVWSMTRASDPDNTKSAYSGTVTSFCLRCHDGAPPTAVTNQSNTLVPYSVALSDMSAYSFFPGWNKNGFTSGGHATSRVNNMVPGCESCHDPHASDNQRLTAATAYYTGGGASPPSHINARRDNTTTYAEEDLCFVCHLAKRSMPNCAGGACHSDIDSQTDVKVNVETAFSAASGNTWRHPVEASDKHSDTEVGASGLGSVNRHAECVDCHDPHLTKPGKHTAGSANAGSILLGAKGIKPVYGTSGNWQVMTGQTAVTLGSDGTDDYEAYLCFKCHSAYSGQPFAVTSTSGTNYTSTDLALEFNPANDSGHNVVGNIWPKTSNLGPNNRTWSLPTDANWLRTGNGWSRDSMVTCSDCHAGDVTSNGARGPHGSSVRYIMDENYTGNWTTAYLNTGSANDVSSNIICIKCHTNFRNMNGVHQEHDDRGSFDARCTGCHVKVPHGWKRPRLIGYTDDPAPYASDALIDITDRNYTPTGWNKDYCYETACGEHSSGSFTSPAWP